MNQKEVFAKIGGIIKELNDQYAYLHAEPDNLNSLELELFVSNARFLTNHIEILAKLNSQYTQIQPVQSKPEPKQEQSAVEPPFQHPIPEKEKEIDNEKPAEPETQPVPDINLGEAGGNDSYSYIRQQPETIRHEFVLDESINWEDNDEDLEEENKAPKVSHEKVQTGATGKKAEETEARAKADQPTPEKSDHANPQVKSGTQTQSPDDVVTINQKISSQLGGKASAHAGPLADVPIADIKQAITLNDKLLFIKDLFNGYSLAYSEAIEILNRFSSFEEATNFLNKNYAVKNNWESKPETVAKFYALVKRRYA